MIDLLRSQLLTSVEQSGVSQARAVFFRSLSTLIDSGINIVRALDVLLAQCDYPPMQRTLRRALVKVSQGQRLSKALAPEAGERSLISPLQLQLIAVGENSGSLHRILGSIARDCERSNDIERRLVAALVYPVLILFATLVLVVLLQSFVLKDLLGMLTSLHTELPWPTRLLALSCKLASNPLALTVCALVFGWGLLEATRRSHSPAFRRLVWTQLMRAPAIRSALRLTVTIQLSRALSTCMKAGLSLPRCLELAGSASFDPFLPEAMARVSALVIDGEPLARALRAQNIFPPMLIHCVAAGEQVGKIPLLLEKVADSLEDSLEQALSAAAALLQPLILVLVGALVGFVVVATMMPLLRLADAL